MNIFFDLDETLVDLTIEIHKIAKKYKIKEYPRDWVFSNYPEKVKKEIFDIFKNPKIMCNLKPLKYSKKLIGYLQNENNRVGIITARHDSIKKDTIKFVEQLFNITPIVVHFNQSKLKILEDQDCDLYIDDCPHQVLEIQKSGIKTILISNHKTLYNHYARLRCLWFKNLKQVYKFLKDMV